MTSGTRIAVGFGALLALGFAVLIGYAPEALPPAVQQAVQTAIGDLDPSFFLVAVGVMVGILGLFSSWSWRTTTRSARLVDADVETPDRDVRLAGAALTQQFEAWRDGAASLSGGSLDGPLRDVLLDVYAAEFGDRETAIEYVDRGEWTGDPLAAAMLTETDEVDYPLVHRLYAWLYPGRAYERRARRTLRAVEAACAQRYSDYDPPDRSSSRLERLQSVVSGRGEDE
ncbi:hypothetical protein [Halorhabdus sp. BNX81]|uniref:DUF7269 family protein n=1 Tax=Halorhabdus sp. BNX81 TaxID=2980181 RepID=UPI0023DD4E9B|nr:hypothetical protein [Halorhabdus sp. BNX81]WEL22741.1 putative membrane protein [Halorhabdus sp. BNX81]